MVEGLPGWPRHLKQLKKLGRVANARPFGRGIRFSPADEREYRVTRRYLEDLEITEQISWFTYSRQEDQFTKVAIRGLPFDTPTEELLEEFRVLGFEPVVEPACVIVEAWRGKRGPAHRGPRPSPPLQPAKVPTDPLTVHLMAAA